MTNIAEIARYILNPRPSRPTIILIHGGWQGPEIFSLIIPRLEKAGYSVFAPSLPSSGTVPAVSSFDEDVKVIHHAVSSMVETGKDVILVMHSYGALPGCEALKDMKVKKNGIKMENGPGEGVVIKLVFLAGLIVAEGGSTEKPGTGDSVPGFGYTVTQEKPLPA